MLPALMGRTNVEDVYAQYAAQIDKLESAQTPLPTPTCIEDLVAALDLVSPPEDQ